jgi:hypothetical protein
VLGFASVPTGDRTGLVIVIAVVMVGWLAAV